MNRFETPIAGVRLEDLIQDIPYRMDDFGNKVVDFGTIRRMGPKDAKTFVRMDRRTLADGKTVDVPVMRPVVPTGTIWSRPEWATSIAREEGAILAGVQLIGCADDEGIPEIVMEILMGSGIQIPGVDWPASPDGRKCGWVRFMTQAAKSNTAVLPVADYAWAKGMEAMFPAAGDAVRPGALLSPLRGGYYKVTANVLVCEDEDVKWKFVADGQGMIDRRWARKNGVNFKADPQFRALIGLDRPWSERVLGKGTLKSGRLPDGIDLIMPKSVLKHRKGVTLECGMHTFVMGLGVMNGEEERLAGPMYIGEQVWQWFGSDVLNLANDLVSAKLGELNAKVNDVRWLAKRGTGLRDEEGKLQQFELLQLFAQVCVDIGDLRLMRSKLVQDALSEFISVSALETMLGLGTYAWRFRLVARKTLTPGFVALNPQVYKHLFNSDSEVTDTIGIRYPFAERDEMVAIWVVPDQQVRWYEAHTNPETFNRAAADFDGDSIGVVRPDAHVLAARKLVEHLPYVGEKVRQSAQPPASKARMISQSMNSGVGLIDHTISKWVYNWHVKPTWRAKVEATIKLLRIELQKAVDSVKKAATADMVFVRQAGKEAKVKLWQVAVRKLRKFGKSYKAFRIFEGKQALADALSAQYGVADVVKKNEPVMPSKFLRGDGSGPLMPLAEFVCQHEDEVPIVQLAGFPNKYFDGWLPLNLTTKDEQFFVGYLFTEPIVKEFNQKLAKLYEMLDLGQLDEGSHTEALDAVLTDYREFWRRKALEMAADKAWLRGAATATWNAWANGSGKGYALRYAVPDVVCELLVENADRIRATADTQAIVGMILGGQEFRAKYMGGDDRRKMIVTVLKHKGVQYVSALGGQPHKLVNVNMPEGDYEVIVAGVNGMKSLTATFTGRSLEIVEDIPMDSVWEDDGTAQAVVKDDEEETPEPVAEAAPGEDDMYALAYRFLAKTPVEKVAQVFGVTIERAQAWAKRFAERLAEGK
jgi:hypothetical protein